MKRKILLISIVFMLLSLIFINNSVFATTYDLNDYKNRSLVGGKWVIIYSLDHDKIYLLTLERSDYPYFWTSQYTGEDAGDKIMSGGSWISSRSNTSPWSSQGHVKYYTFNTETQVFENLTSAGIGDSAFKPRQE